MAYYYYNNKLRISDNEHPTVQEFDADERKWKKVEPDLIRGKKLIHLYGSYIRVEDLLEIAKQQTIDPSVEQIIALKEQGYSQKDISTMTGESLYKVRKSLKNIGD